MEPVTKIVSTLVALPNENIDTDQIIPARFLKVTDKDGLGEALFADWRYDGEGQPDPDFVLNRPEAQTARVLVGGHNFGCGSSREHAPWALIGYGFQAVVSTYFADIFRNNALKNGLLPITVDHEVHQQLIAIAEAGSDSAAGTTTSTRSTATAGAPTVEIDLESQTLTLPGGESTSFPIDPFSKHCLLNGIDQLGFLIAEDDAITAYEETHPARVQTKIRTAAGTHT